MPDTPRQALWRTAMADGFCVYQEHKLADQTTAYNGMPQARYDNVARVLEQRQSL